MTANGDTFHFRPAWWETESVTVLSHGWDRTALGCAAQRGAFPAPDDTIEEAVRPAELDVAADQVGEVAGDGYPAGLRPRRPPAPPGLFGT